MDMTGKKPDLDSLETTEGKPVIAVIDDEDKWLNVYKRMFRTSGYCIDTFSDPQVFLETIKTYPNRFVGIICDIKMPMLSGHKVFEIVKENKDTQDIPFLIVSGVLTQDQNLSKIQTIAYVSKMDDNLRTKIFKELIEVVENWPKVKNYLQAKNVAADKIDFFCQFYINYQKFFNEILRYINQMEQACVNCDANAIDQIAKLCTDYMDDLHNKCMSIIFLLQESPERTSFIRKVCERGRSSLTMIQSFQLIFFEEASSNEEFQEFLKECRDSLEKIIIGTEKGYNLRES
ncbi:MAG: response regulator [Proteobacteria bacterium]|nr:response regulator [Pseudomonadota bacterium]